jgi:hypothetical protein
MFERSVSNHIANDLPNNDGPISTAPLPSNGTVIVRLILGSLVCVFGFLILLAGIYTPFVVLAVFFSLITIGAGAWSIQRTVAFARATTKEK